MLEEWLNMFYDEKKEKEQRKAEEEAHIRIEGLQIDYLKSRTVEELDELQYEINQMNEKIEHATNIESIKYKVERYIAFFEQEKELTNESISIFR
jgi:UDP-N-acetylglucosamine pyrophosphorylase